MRVALIVPTFPKLSESFIARKFLGLLDRGIDMHVVCAASASAEWENFPGLRARARGRIHLALPTRPRILPGLLAVPLATVCLARRPGTTLGYLMRGWGALGLRVYRYAYVDQPLVMLKPDLVSFEFGALSVGRMHLRKLLGCAVVVGFRGYDLNFCGLEQDEYYREVWEKADAFHFLGEDLWHRAVRRGCPPDSRKELIPPAVDVDFWRPTGDREGGMLGTPDRPLKILSVGRLEWKKGHEYALLAVRILLDRGLNCEYVVVGGGKYLEAVAFARHQLGLNNHVMLRGPLAPTEVRGRMGWADVFLHAAVSEGFCNAVLEAQAMGLPVVTSDADGLRENVAKEETGFVVSRRDPAEFADRLERIAKDGSLRLQMGESARKRTESHFPLARELDSFERFYRSFRSAGRAEPGF